MNNRIVFIEPSGRGGIGQYTYCLAREMVRLGMEVHVATSTDWEFRDCSSGIQSHLCFSRYKTNPWSVCRELKEIAGKDPLAIHWQSASHPVMLLFLLSFVRKRLSHLPWAFTVHNVLPHEVKLVDRLCYSSIYRQMDGLIFHGRTSRDRFERLFSLKGHGWAIIPHGQLAFHFESKSSPGPNLEKKNILFFGNIRPYKGLIYLLRAFQLVREEIPGVRLQIVGQPLEDFTPYQKEIRSSGNDKGCRSRIAIISQMMKCRRFSPKPQLWRCPYTDIYQSAVLLLAYGAGLPVVASSVGDLSDAVIEGRNRTPDPA